MFLPNSSYYRFQNNNPKYLSSVPSTKHILRKMKGEETRLTKMIKNADQLCIPVYQRDYNWGKDQCRQLYDDLTSVIIYNRSTHFFGSVVDAQDPNGGKDDYIIIDGQQRITTISLLLLAFKNLLLKNELILSEYTHDNLLKRVDAILINEDEEIRLNPAPNSKTAYFALFKDEEDFIQDSNVTANYTYFLNRLREDKEQFSADQIWNAVNSLNIIDIYLEAGDDAQLIFESLNSTGLALSEGDKIRNYLMMSLSIKEQERYYEEYWRKIEANTNPRTDFFIRDFLTIKTRRTPNRDNIYNEFKSYIRNLNKEEIISEMLRYSKYCLWVYHPEKADAGIREALTTLRKLDFGVADPYLFSLLDTYKNGELKEIDVSTSVGIIENYLFRRKICEVATNALNKIFTTLHSDVIKLKGNSEDYSERLRYILLKKEGSGRFPRDEEFVEQLQTRDIYHSMTDKYKMYLLERLEQFGNDEKIDISYLMENGKCSIEHVMPQTLTPQWIEDLGGEEDAERIHKTWLHRLGNLSLTAYNSRYSNSPFTTKLTIENGFKDSKFTLNKFIAACDKWTEEEIIQRTAYLIDRSKKIWPEITTSFVEEKKREGDFIRLGSGFSFTGTQIVGFNFENTFYEVSSWKEFLVTALQILYDIDKEPLQNIALSSNSSGPMNSLVSSEHDLEFWKIQKVNEDVFVNVHSSTADKLRLLISCLDIYHIPPSSIQIRVKEGAVGTEGRYHARRRFWEILLPVINELTPSFSNRSPSWDPWMTAGAGVRGGLEYRLYFSSKICSTGFQFNMRDREENLQYFDAVFSRKDEIESALGVELSWERHENQRLSMVNVIRTDLRIDNEEDWEEAVTFMSEWHSKIYAVFQPILEKL